MTITARERAYALYKEGFDTGTKIRKQLEAEGFEGVSRGSVENWRRRDKWDAEGGVEAIKAVAKQIRKGKDIATRAGQTQPHSEAMRGSISNALNELGALASEGAQALRAMIPNVVGEIKTVAEFNSMARAMAEITSLTVSACVDLFKVMPDLGPGGGGPGGGPGGGSKMIGEHSEIEKVYSDAISEFRKKYG
jgi:hypothetical protein